MPKKKTTTTPTTTTLTTTSRYDNVVVRILQLVVRFIEWILSLIGRRPPAKVVILINGKGGETMFILHNDKPASATLSFVDSEGIPTTAPDGAVAIWAASDPEVLTVTPSADGLSCEVNGDILAGQTSSQAQLQVSITAGGQQFNGTADIQVVPGAAAGIQITLQEL